MPYFYHHEQGAYSRVILLYLLVSIVLVSGFFSAPFPSEYGLPEAFIGVLLVCLSLFSLSFVGKRISMRAALLFLPFLYLLFVPSCVSVLRLNSLSDYLRDIVPLLFIFLPAILLPLIERQANIRGVLVLCVAMFVSGIVISLRYIYGVGAVLGEYGRGLVISESAYYTLFAYDSLIAFVCIVGVATSLILTLTGKGHERLLGLLIGGVSLIAFIPPIGIVQRVPLVMIFFSLMIVVIMIGRERPKIYGYVACLAVGMLVFFGDILLGSVLLIVEKTTIHGANGKIIELIAVFNKLFEVPSNVLFGIGWGGLYENPVLHGEARYTHSLLTFIVLKTGVIGLLFFLIYLFWFLKRLFLVARMSVKYNIRLLSVSLYICTMFTISLFQPVYKTLNFGISMVLLLFVYYGMVHHIKTLAVRMSDKN